jgi:hypothetical protein
LTIVTMLGVFLFRKIFGQTRYIAKPSTVIDETMLEVPGALGARTRLLPLVDVPGMAGAAIVYDRNKSNPTATAVIRVETESWHLANEEVQAARADALSAICKELSTDSEIARVGFYSRTYGSSQSGVPTPKLIFEDSHIGDLAREDYEDLVANTAVGQILRRDVLIAVVVSTKKAAAEIRAQGGDLPGVSKVLAKKVARLIDMLPAAGAITGEDAHWLSAGELRACIRLVNDPQAAGFLEDNGWVQPAGVERVYFDEFPTHLATSQGAYHRGYWVEQWPVTTVAAGFLYDLVARGDVPHTFTQIWEGIDLHKSEKELNNQKVSLESSEKVDQKLGRPISVSHEAEGRDINLRFQEMQAGFGDVRYSGWIVVHADSLAELNAADSWVKESTIGMRLNKATGTQLATFFTAAYPLGHRDVYA